MDETRKKWIVENSQGCTLEGSATSVAGWKTDAAGLAPGFGGFWSTSWETAERVVMGDKKFTAADVRLSSWLWGGYGEEVPAPLAHWTKSTGMNF